MPEQIADERADADERSRGPGRPSVVDERRSQIIDAYVSLTRERRHPNTPLSEVAKRAGVHRSALRHFVGNRDDLVAAAIDEVWARHDATFTTALGPEPTLDATIDHLFSERYTHEHADVDDVFELLVAAATDDEPIRERIRVNYRRTVDELAAMIDDTHPDPEGAAYSVLCLAEHNAALQRLGFDPALADSAREVARTAVERPCRDKHR